MLYYQTRSRCQVDQKEAIGWLSTEFEAESEEIFAHSSALADQQATRFDWLIALHNAEIDDAQMLIVEMILNAREVARRQVASEDYQ